MFSKQMQEWDGGTALHRYTNGYYKGDVTLANVQFYLKGSFLPFLLQFSFGEADGNHLPGTLILERS